MAANYTHDNEMITITNCLVDAHLSENVYFKKCSWYEKLEIITNKIKEKWNINNDIKWILSINNQLIDKNDVNTFKNILCVLPSPITINIIAMHNNCIEEEKK
eukprot:377804_1